MIAKKLIILNGPPRSGKDTAANYLWYKVGRAQIMRMSSPLKSGLHAFFHMTQEEIKAAENSKGATAADDVPLDFLYDKTWRNAQISLSEDWAKQFFGPDVFGRIFARRLLAATSDVIICPDSGFAHEWALPVQYVRPQNALLLKLHRPGATFEGDSRGYIDLPNVRTIWIHNDGEQTTFEKNILAVVNAWLSI